MNWQEIDLNSVVPTAPERTEVPTGTYKFRLVGSKPNPFREGDTDIDFVIAEGDQKGRHVFASLPTPDTGNWVTQAAALLIKSLGISQQAGEDLVDTLSRGAANGAGPIYASITENRYTDKSGTEKVGRPKFQYFSVSAAV